jgi:hypothetical protein
VFVPKDDLFTLSLCSKSASKEARQVFVLGPNGIASDPVQVST